MPEIRKLAAILAVDVVGWSRLMGEDEAGTARAVRERREAVRPPVASLDGRVVTMIGRASRWRFPRWSPVLEAWPSTSDHSKQRHDCAEGQEGADRRSGQRP